MIILREDAERKAKELAKRLNNHFNIIGWKSNVWNNLGWCYDVSLGSIAVSPSSHGKYYIAYVNSTLNETGGALAAWFNDEECYNKIPEKAVLGALKCAEDYTNELKETIDNNKSKLKI